MYEGGPQGQGSRRIVFTSGATAVAATPGGDDRHPFRPRRPRAGQAVRRGPGVLLGQRIRTVAIPHQSLAASVPHAVHLDDGRRQLLHAALTKKTGERYGLRRSTAARPAPAAVGPLWPARPGVREPWGTTSTCREAIAGLWGELEPNSPVITWARCQPADLQRVEVFGRAGITGNRAEAGWQFPGWGGRRHDAGPVGC